MDELTTESPYELEKDLKFIKEIDHGAFGEVIHAYETKQNLDLAIKVINKFGANNQIIKEMKEEISILKKINHDNIVKFYGYSETYNQLLIKMEYIKYGTLSNWMKNHHKITEEEASLVIGKVLSAVEYLHSMQICHRDIKPENIMISKENDLSSIKIIDFGLSAQQFNYLSNNEYCGTFLYMAPEQIEKKLYHFSVDIWSIGILMYMLLNNGKHPFYQKGDKKQDFIKKIKSGKLNFINKLSFMAKNLNYKLCEPNPSLRYSTNLAMKHPWITRNPNDEIPLTFNDILNRNNCKKNAYSLMMIIVFLNYYKKKDIKKKLKEMNNSDNSYNFDFFIKKKRMKNNKIYIIKKEYINKCILINKKKKEKLLKIKEKYLDVLSSDEDEEGPSNKKPTLNNLNKRNKKLTDRLLSPKKKFYLQDSINEYIKNNKLQKNINNLFNKNSLVLNNKEITIQNNHKLYSKEKSKLYLSYVPTNEFRHQKSDEINDNNNKIKKTLITNNNKVNINNRSRAKSKSISKFNTNKVNKVNFKQEINDENKIFNENNKEINDENKIINENNKELTPKKSNKNNNINNKSNLPYVFNIGNHIKTNANLTNKKYHNNYIWNYNIIPLELPFIRTKQEEEKRNVMV